MNTKTATEAVYKQIIGRLQRSDNKVCSRCGKQCKPETYRINVCSDPIVVSNCCKAAFTDSPKDDLERKIKLWYK